MSLLVFFFNDTATTEIYTLSLHDALPISQARRALRRLPARQARGLRSRRRALSRSHVRRHDVDARDGPGALRGDRKSTRLNSSHSQISYAVFCLKKKKEKRD